ncbi:gluconate 2-dehydrogenase [Caballeronia udeis]|uniref:Gluconate 2-dehydrogenase n=1 Tax=Caballeronia udeis TaxID=1232866 RepID=A0A158JI47_9BURK|nr:NAD(P)-dependent oxidoreductase [Caballeronia udeis]SAL68547.1 gluconate 2-dehydrogenase [Caballeronia udeis]
MPGENHLSGAPPCEGRARGPIVDHVAILGALTTGQIAGAAMDVYDAEPLDNPQHLRESPNVLATPHIGCVSMELYRTF